MNPFRPFVFGLLLGGAAIVAAIVAAQLEDDDESPSPDEIGQPRAEDVPPEVFPSGFEVVAVTLTRGSPRSTTPLPLDIRRASDRPIIEMLRSWVVQASPARRPVTITSDSYGAPIYLAFHGRDGTAVTLSPAEDCTIDGDRTTCDSLPNSVDVLREESPVRLYSPDLAEWLRTGWENDLRTGTAEQLEREWAALGIARR